MINSHLVKITIIITGFLSLSLILFPELDLAFSRFFFTKESGFIYRENFWVYQIYQFLPLTTKLFGITCLLYLIHITIKYKNLSKVTRSAAFFLLISAAIVPGLVVNSVLKENFGRARPTQVKEFGGNKEFTDAYRITDQCKSNCSFSSGHAAMGYFYTAIAYTVNTLYFNKIYMAGFIFGSIVGLSRIMMGGHFLSDVLASAFIVLFLNHFIFIIWQKLTKDIRSKQKPKSKKKNRS